MDVRDSRLASGYTGHIAGPTGRRERAARDLMIHSLQIDGYRGFDSFSMDSLGLVNLLVGKNNSGKTSVLEALYLLGTGGDPYAFWQLCTRRGERMVIEKDTRAPETEIDIAHLFFGHDLQIGSKFSLSALNQKPEKVLTFSIGEMSDRDRDVIEEDDIRSRLALYIKGSGNGRPVPISGNGGISFSAIDRLRRVRRLPLLEPNRSQFVSTDSLSGDELLRLWEKVALQPSEQLVLKALQFLDPQIERIAVESPEGPDLSSNFNT